MANGQLPPLLEKQRIFRSRNPDEAVAFLPREEIPFRSFAPGGQATRSADQRHLSTQPLCRLHPIRLAGYNQTNPERDDYWLQLPIREHIEFTVAHQCIACGPLRAAVSSPTNGLLIRTNARGARFNISFTASALTRQLAGLLGAAPTKPLRVCIIDEPERRLRSQPGPMRVWP